MLVGFIRTGRPFKSAVMLLFAIMARAALAGCTYVWTLLMRYLAFVYVVRIAFYNVCLCVCIIYLCGMDRGRPVYEDMYGTYNECRMLKVCCVIMFTEQPYNGMRVYVIMEHEVYVPMFVRMARFYLHHDVCAIIIPYVRIRLNDI
jgi:hypothetical protein